MSKQNLYNVKGTYLKDKLKIKIYDTPQVRNRKSNDKLEKLEDGTYYFKETGEVTGCYARINRYEKNKLQRDRYNYLSEEEKKFINKLKSLKRTRETMKDLIQYNITKNVKFLTLTFKENITDFKFANDEFTKFIKRLKRASSVELKYIAILEAQKRGSIHYHIILFDYEYKKFSEYLQLWGNGSVYIESLLSNGKQLKVDCSQGDVKVNNEKINNLSAYICKSIDYMTKTLSKVKSLSDLEDLRNTEEGKKYLFVFDNENMKLFNRSRNLKVAPVFYYYVDKNSLEELRFNCEFNEGYHNTFSSDYVTVEIHIIENWNHLIDKMLSSITTWESREKNG